MAALYLLFCAFGFPCIALFSGTIWFGTALSEVKAGRQSDPNAKRTEVYLSGTYLAVSIALSLLSALAFLDVDLSQMIWRTVGVVSLIAGVCLAPVSSGVWLVRAGRKMKNADNTSAEYAQQKRNACFFGAVTFILCLAVAAAWVLLFQGLPAD